MDPTVQIRLVRENLGLAIALWAAAEKGIISAGFVPNHSEVESPDGQFVRVSTHLEVHDTRDLVRCAHNQIRGAFAFSALQANRALESTYGNSPIKDAASEIQASRCILYLFNKTVTDDLMAPVWVCPPEYRRTFEVPTASFTLDASALNGKAVRWDDFGGLSKYLDLLEFCAAQIAELSGAPSPTELDTEPVSKSIINSAPDSPTEQAVTDATPLDSVWSFVESRCLVGDSELIIAGDLFRAYLAWCASEGLETSGQRSFGMRLSAWGFDRRRRGKGKHWWMGIALTRSQAESQVVASGVAS